MNTDHDNTEREAAEKLSELGFTIVDVRQLSEAEKRRWWECPVHGNQQRTHLPCRTCELRHQVGLNPEASWDDVLAMRQRIESDLGHHIDWEVK